MARQGTPHDEYVLLEQVGTGSFGTVHRARHKATQQVVCLFFFFFSPFTHTHTPWQLFKLSLPHLQSAMPYTSAHSECHGLGCHQGDEEDEPFSWIHQHAWIQDTQATCSTPQHCTITWQLYWTEQRIVFYHGIYGSRQSISAYQPTTWNKHSFESCRSTIHSVSNLVLLYLILHAYLYIQKASDIESFSTSSSTRHISSWLETRKPADQYSYDNW